MKKCIPFLVLLLFTLPALSFAQEPKLLFLYDKMDKDSEFYVSTFQNELNLLGIDFDTVSVAEIDSLDLSIYDPILIYSKVMAFNLDAPVRKWLSGDIDLTKKDIYIYVTAGRWRYKKHKNQLVELTEEKGGNIVDAVTMPTKDMSREDKTQNIKEILSKLP